MAGRRELRALLLWACWRFGLLPTGTQNPSIEGRPDGVCKDGWEVEKTTRATGLKKCQNARGDEPAERIGKRSPRENEPGDVGQEMSTSHEAPRDDEPGSTDDEMWMPCDGDDENLQNTLEHSVEELLGSPVLNSVERASWWQAQQSTEAKMDFNSCQQPPAASHH